MGKSDSILHRLISWLVDFLTYADEEDDDDYTEGDDE